MTRFLPLIFVVLGTAILLGLGSWQMQRLAWKEDLIAKREAGLVQPPVDLSDQVKDWRDFDFRHVSLQGQFRHDLEQLYGVRARSNVVGHHVLTPLTRADGTTFLIDRGWVPADKVDPRAREQGQPSGPVTVSGIARYRQDDRPGSFTPDNDPAERRWYHYDLEAMEDALGIDLAPLVVVADDTPNPGGLPVGGGMVTELTNNHRQYAITWYGLAVVLIAVYMVFRRQQAKPKTAA